MIRGERVSLRPVEPRDHPLIAAWQNQPEVWWWMDYDRPFSLADIADSEKRASEEGRPFVIEVDGRPIGRIGLNAFRPRDRICALYVFIGEPSAWGRGLGRDAVRTLVAFAFDRFDLERIELWSLASNDRAIRAYRACGFEVDATLERRSFRSGDWVDRVVMSVTRDAFARAGASR
jgi:RimJ/RimL family protein N-acetyltransferase